jgi:hypothetical protein
MRAQIRLVPDPVPDTAKETPKEVPTAPTAPERLVPPAPPADPAQPPTQASDAPSDPTSPVIDRSDPAGTGPAAKVPVLDIIDLAGDEVYVPDASVTDTLSRVEGELRKFLKISTTEPGLRLRLQKPFAAGWVSGIWRYLSADNLQVWAMWAYPSNNPSALNFLATFRFIPTDLTDEAQARDPANFTIGEDRQMYVWNADLNISGASWNPGRPLSFSATLVRDGTAGSGLSVGTIRDALAAYPNLEIVAPEGSPAYFGISADFQASTEFPGLQPILDVHRTLQKLAKLGTGPANGTTAPPSRPEPPVTQDPALTGNPRTEEPRNEAPADTATPSDRTASNPTEAPSPKLDSILRETGNVPSSATADGGLAGLSLRADYPKIEVAENRAYIPLFFTVLGTYTGTNDVVVRARFVSGTATPGADFELGEPERSLPAQGGLTTMSWIPVPTLYDEVNEGDETAVFEVFIVGSTNAPVRIEATLRDDLNPGEVGFISTRFQINEGSTYGYAQIRLWRTLNTREAATVSYRLDGPAAALAVLGGQTRRTATFQPGDSQVFVQIPLVNDTTAQGTQDVTLTLEPVDGGLKLMKGFETSVLTVADDETPGASAPLSISQYELQAGLQGVALTTTVPRGYQVRLEYSDAGAAGPWKPYWTFEGSDVERSAFDSFEASVMRMYRILPPEPLDFTYPW